MSTAPVIDLEALLAPVDGENPAGSPPSLSFYGVLDADRKEFQTNPDDPQQDPTPRKVDWGGIIRRVSAELVKSKDLGLAIRLCEALTKLHGYAGLRDGFRLLQAMVEQCWDRIHPIPDVDYGEGMEVRAAPFDWIGDESKGAGFPNTVRGIPLLALGSQTYTVYDYEQLRTAGKGPIPREDMGKLKLIEPQLAEDVFEAAAAFRSLDQALTDKLGSQGPGLSPLAQAMEQCERTAQQFSTGATPSVDPSADGETAGYANGSASSSASRQVSNRQEAYQQLEQIADILQRLEPHSPIPYLIRRAVELGNLPFHLLINEIVRDEARMMEIRREFGIRE